MMTDRRIIATDQAAAAVGPYSQGTSANRLVFISGQLPINLEGAMPEGIEAQTRQSLENLLAVLKASGSSRELVLKTTVFLKNMDDFAAMNAIYAEVFGASPPARSTVEVARLPRNALVEIECIACVG
jgi:2-iminobutanoate/2-iminopropanoate deaminase